jgi:protein MpaA
MRVLALFLAALPIGHSVQGRAIRPVVLGDPGAARRVLVVGCIHGNEPAGMAIARRLVAAGAPRGTEIVVVQALNPDECGRGVRGNAHGVDLNRNFLHRWKRLGGALNSGPRPASEPETRALMGLIRRLRPAVTIWFHQHLNMVVLTRGNLGLQRRFARLAGLRAGYIPGLTGTATGWSNANFPGTTAFVVELPAGRLSRAGTARLARAVRLVSAPLGTTQSSGSPTP